MQLLLIALVGVLVASGVYLILRRNLLQVVFGIVLLSNGVNVLIMAAGRVTAVVPPLVPDGAGTIEGATANPLAQALILTAIVIGMGLVAFALTLVLRARNQWGTVDGDAIAKKMADEPASSSSSIGSGASSITAERSA